MTTTTWLWICLSCWTLGNLSGSVLAYWAHRKSADKALEYSIQEIRRLGEFCRVEIEKAYDERDAALAQQERIRDVRRQIESNPFPPFPDIGRNRIGDR